MNHGRTLPRLHSWSIVIKLRPNHNLISKGEGSNITLPLLKTSAQVSGIAKVSSSLQQTKLTYELLYVRHP